jgi:hypothetical protein
MSHISWRCAIGALAFAISALGGLGCAEVGVSSFANLDPAGHSALIIGLDALGLDPIEVPLQGRLKGTATVRGGSLLSSEGLRVFLNVDSIQVAGPSADVSGISTGTICISGNPDDPSGGVAYVRRFRSSEADIHLAAIATSQLLEALAPGGIAVATDLNDVSLRIDWRRLLLLNLEGAIRASVVVMLELPADVPLLSGAPVTLVLDLVSSSKPSSAPLLSDCS